MHTLKSTQNWRIPSEYLIQQGPKIKFKSIMIVDDAELDLYITSRMIINMSIETRILQYSTAQEALEYLELNQENIEALPEVIFIDIFMPLMSGFEFMKAYDKLSVILKEHCKLFIVSSASNDREIEQIRSDKNVVSVQEKPITKYFLENIETENAIKLKI